jgi:superfamily II DNA or RNA helicase/HKD family nuclease
MPLPHGLYDLVLTLAQERRLPDPQAAGLDLHDLHADEAPDRLSELLGAELRRILAGASGADAERRRVQLELVNGLLRALREPAGGEEGEADEVPEPPRVLRSISPAVGAPPAWPETGLSAPFLFTAGKGSPALVTELRREAASCDRIDILVSFITVSGVRKLIDVLKTVTAAGAGGAGRTTIRVLTTTYTGATQLEAIDQLARLNGCEVRISLDGRRTRLHAKAWIFQRATGFGSAYVGSANLSGAALMGGLEWTVKLTERGQEALYARAKAHFDTLWEDGEFTRFRPDDPESRAAVAAALKVEGGFGKPGDIGHFDIQPKPFQEEMLAELERERSAGRNRNLLVAATGTGKTVVAALDYRATSARMGGQRPRLLFVAHRAQILRQALRTYREVLRDHEFGELMTGGAMPAAFDHLFVTIDTLTSRGLVEQLGADHWHTVVIDECHRLAANRFHQLATTIRPAHLLGLTATPERSDGRSLEQYFTPRPDRSPAVELRLWDALDMQLLAPFEYFAVDDETDFSDVPWEGAGERVAIERHVVGNRGRARRIVDEWRRLAGDPGRGRALVFCVSVAHAEFMGAYLNEAGIPAMVVTGETPRAEQLRAPHRLARGDFHALVTVDLYNEGVDIPEVDTLLLLRPTQSPVLFQQQLGRGLRLNPPAKESCLVLDFVGVHRADFRFDRLLSAITGLSRRQLIEAVEHGFTDLGPGCHIHLQRQTRAQVLHGLRSLTQQRWARLAAEVQAFSALQGRREVGLGEFLHEQRVELGEVYRSSGRAGWTTLKGDAGLTAPADDGEARLSGRLGGLLHVDDAAYLGAIRRMARIAAGERVIEDDPVRMQMLTYQLFGREGAAGPEMLRERLVRYGRCAGELEELADVLEARSRVDAAPLPGAGDVPLRLHAAYEVREIQAAFGVIGPGRFMPLTAGVFPIAERRTELLFVTLDKSAGFRDHLAFHDYAVSPTRFHWQTQNSAGPDTRAGRRYLESPGNGWTFQLFVRVRRGEAYRACGEVHLADHADSAGDRPMNIEWTLRSPLPPQLFSQYSVLRRSQIAG